MIKGKFLEKKIMNQKTQEILTSLDLDINPEEKIREVVDACADCDICRSLMDSTCLVFPELYRL